MATSHVVLVREPPPQLEKLNEEACLKFFREFACWKIKEKRRKTVKDMEEVQMADATSGAVLVRMLKLTVDELPEGTGRDHVKVKLQVPLTPMVPKTPKVTKTRSRR